MCDLHGTRCARPTRRAPTVRRAKFGAVWGARAANVAARRPWVTTSYTTTVAAATTATTTATTSWAH